MNQMTITAILWGQNGEYLVPIYTNEDKTVVPEERIIGQKQPSLTAKSESNTMKDLLLGACLCNNATIQSSSSTEADGAENEAMETNDDETSKPTTKLVGDAADVALYRLCEEKCSIDIGHVRKCNPRINAVPFNSKNKFMLTANLLEQNSTSTDDNVLITLKGAPDFILSRCSMYKDDEGIELMPMTDEFKTTIQQRQEALGKSGYRVIAMVQQTISKDKYDANMQEYKKAKKSQQAASDEPDLNGLPNNKYCFIGEYKFDFVTPDNMLCTTGMFSLLDPARPEVPNAVLKARRAQIRVAMVTGDHPTTAAAIAKKVNILSQEISINGGIDTFRIEHDNKTGQILAHLMRNTTTLLETHVISELTTNIEAACMKTLATDDNTVNKKKKKKPNICKRIMKRILFYFSDPNQVKDIVKLEMIPYGVVVAGSDIPSMDVSEVQIQSLVYLSLHAGLHVGLGFVTSRACICTNIARTKAAHRYRTIEERRSSGSYGRWNERCTGTQTSRSRRSNGCRNRCGQGGW